MIIPAAAAASGKENKQLEFTHTQTT